MQFEFILNPARRSQGEEFLTLGEHQIPMMAGIGIGLQPLAILEESFSPLSDYMSGYGDFLGAIVNLNSRHPIADPAQTRCAEKL